MKQVKQILSNLVLWYLRAVARIALSLSRATVIGIAGSVGKTSTREAMYAILRSIAPTHMVAGNSETGVPLGLVGLFPRDYSPFDWLRMLVFAPLRIGFLKPMRYIIVEMGIDDPYPPKNMGYLLTIVKPHVGIITQESAAHTRQFEKIMGSRIIISDMERTTELVKAITREDAKMLHQARCRVKIINGDNEFLTKEVQGAYTFGTKKDATIRITNYRVDTKQTVFSFRLHNQVLTLTMKGYVFPKELGHVFASVILAATTLSVPGDSAVTLLEKNYVPPRGREGLFAGKNGTVIIDSSYNASRPSVISFLDLVKTLKKRTHRHAVIVLADMLELGNESQLEHEAVAKKLDGVADTLFLVGPLTKRFILPSFPQAQWFPSIVELNEALRQIPKESLILFKGSQGQFWLEESIKLLLKNPSEADRLCRQNDFWKKVKTAAGKWVELKLE